MSRNRIVALIAVAAGLTGTAPSTPPTITDLHPVALHPGINQLPGFLPTGGAATIVEGWRGNGNAHGFHVWMVVGEASEGNPVGLVGLEQDGNPPVADTIEDNPFDGERVLGAVRFATGRMQGRSVSLMIRADLGPSASGVLADHARATVRWYRLDHDEAAMGRPTDMFVPVGAVVSTKRYCNAELALRDVAGLPLPADYEGANRVDGCFADG